MPADVVGELRGPARAAALRRAVSARPGLEPVATALAWLYLYSAAWLTVYAVLAVLAFGWKPVLVTGGSMEPHITAGDVVLVAQPDEPAAEGAVVTYAQPGRDRLVTHRVVEVVPGGYRTRGDANGVVDSDVVPHTAVVGAGRLLIPFLGRPLVWGQQQALLPLSFWAILTGAAVAVASRRPEDDEQPAAVEQPARALRPVGHPLLGGAHA